MSPSATRLLDFVKPASGFGSNNGLKYHQGTAAGKGDTSHNNYNSYKSYPTNNSIKRTNNQNRTSSTPQAPPSTPSNNNYNNAYKYRSNQNTTNNYHSSPPSPPDSPPPTRHQMMTSTTLKNHRSNNNHNHNNNNHHSHIYHDPGYRLVQEMDTFASNSPTLHQNNNVKSKYKYFKPVLPSIECSNKQVRLAPLTIEEYEANFRRASDLELVDRVFHGSIACDELRAALWPYLFGLVSHRGRFSRTREESSGQEVYTYLEHEENKKRWKELQEEYNIYQSQWRSITASQESRNGIHRNRKSLIERDVIRCDRLHPFYAEEPQNLATLTNLLMTYTQYDFDIGYMQGMSDLAGPILCMFKGDLIKAFWVFVEVMKLFRRNFESTQKSIHFQLNCLFELIKVTDPIFAQYLEEHDSSNCFFTFRAIVCQLKRELMRDDGDDYSNVFHLWDTIWAVKRRCSLEEEVKKLANGTYQETGSELGEERQKQNGSNASDLPQYNINLVDIPRDTLTETEIFTQALCLTMIRRERDMIMANKLDATDIHLHFMDPKLANNLKAFIEDAINIYFYMKNDLDIVKLTRPRKQTAPIKVPNSQSKNDSKSSPFGSPGSYDLLNDFYVINCVSGSS